MGFYLVFSKIFSNFAVYLVKNPLFYPLYSFFYKHPYKPCESDFAGLFASIPLSKSWIFCYLSLNLYYFWLILDTKIVLLHRVYKL